MASSNDIHPGQVLFSEMQTAAIAGDLDALREALDKWCSEDFGNGDPDWDEKYRWYVPTLAEQFALMEDKRGPTLHWYVMHRVLHFAAKAGQPEVVAFMLEKVGCSITSKAIRGALQNRAFDVMEVFLSHGWDINRPLQRNTCPMLRYPGAFANEPLLGQIVADGSHRDVIHSELHVRWCLEHGADPMARNRNAYQDVLSHAGLIAPLSVFKLLRTYGVDLRQSRALHFAARGFRNKNERLEVMKYLLDECGVNINMLEYEYDSEQFHNWSGLGLGTALHNAVQWDAIVCIKFLLERGIDPEIPDTKGFKSVDIARRHKSEQALALLEGS